MLNEETLQEMENYTSQPDQDDTFPVLGCFWPEIIDYRFVIFKNDEEFPDTDESQRNLTLVKSHKRHILDTILVEISDVGVT